VGTPGIGRKVLKVEKYSILNGDLMVTSVKLSEQSKQVLDALQAEVTLKSGEKISQQELLELLLADARGRKEELISKIKRPKVPLSDKEIKKILSLPRDWGVVTCEDDIDKYLYGKE
jgi:uncharacterized protein (DUF342 family)